MAKYSFQFKKQVIDAYLRGEGGYTYLAGKYGVTNRRQVLNWVHNYQKYGDQGLMRSRKQEKYSFEYKLHVVELYLSSELSYQELALSEGIRNSALITKWVNDFRIAGSDALRPKKKGCKKSLNASDKKTSNKSTETTPVDGGAEHVKQLEDELLKLRIENAYLKELRRLRLEEGTLLKKQRESSTVSGESLN